MSNDRKYGNELAEYLNVPEDLFYTALEAGELKGNSLLMLEKHNDSGLTIEEGAAISPRVSAFSSSPLLINPHSIPTSSPV